MSKTEIQPVYIEGNDPLFDTKLTGIPLGAVPVRRVGAALFLEDDILESASSVWASYGGSTSLLSVRVSNHTRKAEVASLLIYKNITDIRPWGDTVVDSYVDLSDEELLQSFLNNNGFVALEYRKPDPSGPSWLRIGKKVLWDHKGWHEDSYNDLLLHRSTESIQWVSMNDETTLQSVLSHRSHFGIGVFNRSLAGSGDSLLAVVPTEKFPEFMVPHS